LIGLNFGERGNASLGEQEKAHVDGEGEDKRRTQRLEPLRVERPVETVCDET
jgi:hypothetical protein